MPGMDVFNDDVFSTTSLSGMVQKMDYLPNLLGSLNLFDPVPVRTRNIFLDRVNGGLTLIPTSPDGGEPAHLERDTRDAVSLKTTRLAKDFTIYAHEVANLRATGSESELMAVAVEYNNRANRIRQDMEYTWEFHRLGALQGVLLDADGVEVIYDYSAEFNEAIPAATSFELDVDTTDVQKVCKAITRSIATSGKGSVLPGTTVHALAGDGFYDDLVSHPSVEKFYLNQAAAREMQQQQGAIYESFRIGGITFHNYRGSDDGSTISIPADEAKFFPVGARDMFQVAMSPLESFEYTNTLGQPVYMMNVMDQQRNFWAKGEIYSYPLHVCQQPRLLRRGTRT